MIVKIIQPTIIYAQLKWVIHYRLYYIIKKTRIKLVRALRALLSGCALRPNLIRTRFEIVCRTNSMGPAEQSSGDFTYLCDTKSSPAFPKDFPSSFSSCCYILYYSVFIIIVFFSSVLFAFVYNKQWSLESRNYTCGVIKYIIISAHKNFLTQIIKTQQRSPQYY